tara:strand:- start:313 stop:603 length:291 start_codon:yes stop_codon:yes gene_type:complete
VRHLAENKEVVRIKQETVRQDELRDVSWVMQNARGRRLVWRFLESAMVFRTTFTGNSTTFFNEGRRALGLELLADIQEVAGDEYQLMVKEAKDRNG